VTIARCGKRPRGAGAVEDAGDELKPDIIENNVQIASVDRRWGRVAQSAE
jgi:hypothetical protein